MLALGSAGSAFRQRRLLLALLRPKQPTVRGHALAGVACRRRQKKYESPRELRRWPLCPAHELPERYLCTGVMQAQSELYAPTQHGCHASRLRSFGRSELLSETVLI